MADVLDLLDEPAWHKQAACYGQGNRLFYPSSIDQHAERASLQRRQEDDLELAVRLFCSHCPVTEQCAAAGANDPCGIWAGTTPAQRGARPRSTLRARRQAQVV